ncbi:MAG: hypothetical protein ACYCSP_15985 [Acidobacteriaceae bacterium]
MHRLRRFQPDLGDTLDLDYPLPPADVNTLDLEHSLPVEHDD